MKCWSSNLSNSAVKRNAQNSAPPLNLYVNTTGLRTALWRGDLGAELPHLADGSPRPLTEVHDRRLSGVPIE